MTDRELLDLAAKAACIEVVWSDYVSCLCLRDRLPYYVAWNPLADDGAALRLVVSLGLYVLPSTEEVEVVAFQRSPGCLEEADGAVESWTLTDQSPEAATRRAIVRAAAEIGRSMQEAS